jgi:hypothetical protein
MQSWSKTKHYKQLHKQVEKNEEGSTSFYILLQK